MLSFACGTQIIRLQKTIHPYIIPICVSGVVRYLPDGSVSMVVKVPVRYTTCAAFGGEDQNPCHPWDHNLMSFDVPFVWLVALHLNSFYFACTVILCSCIMLYCIILHPIMSYPSTFNWLSLSTTLFFGEMHCKYRSRVRVRTMGCRKDLQTLYITDATARDLRVCGSHQSSGLCRMGPAVLNGWMVFLTLFKNI